MFKLDEARKNVGQYFMDQLFAGEGLDKAARITARWLLETANTQARAVAEVDNPTRPLSEIGFNYVTELVRIANELTESIVNAGDYREVISLNLGSSIEKMTNAYREAKAAA